MQVPEAGVRELESDNDQLRNEVIALRAGEITRGETELLEAPRRLAFALDAAEIGVWDADLITGNARTNLRHNQIFGYTEPVPAWGPDIACEHVVPEDREAFASAFAHALETGTFDLTVRVHWPDGSVHWIHDRGRVEYDEQGRPVRMTGVTLDVTPAKKVEEQLRRNHDTFFSLVQNSPFGVLVVDAQFRLRQVSAGSQKVFSHVHPLINRDFAEVLREIWEEPFASEAIARFRHTLETGEPYEAPNTTEQRHNITDVESYDWRIERITLPDGQFGVVCYFYDLTERKQAEAALQESERGARKLAAALETEREKLATVIENLPVGVGIGDPQGRTLLLNQAGLALHGYTSEAEMPAKPEEYTREFELRYMNGSVIPVEEWPVSRAIHGEFVRGFELLLRNRVTGEARVVSYDVVPVRNGQGAVVLLVYVMQDLTEQERAEEALRVAKEAAEEASLTKSQFLAVMSHELRTPLTAVIGFAELLETEVLGPTTAKQRDALARIQASSWHLVGIIDEILTHSRAEAGKEQIHLEEADVAKITLEVVGIIEPEAEGRGLVLRVQGTEGPAHLWTDPGKVRQILINLVSNAVKYTEEGRVTVEVDRSASEWLQVHVRDTGPGIAPEQQERIFESFTQVDSSHTRGSGGTGLGLAICRRLARLLGGDVALWSIPGEGSTFTLRLPRQGSRVP